MELLETILKWHLMDYSTGIILLIVQSRLYFLALSMYWHDSVAHKHYTMVPWLEHVMRFCMWISSAIWYHGHLTVFTAQHRLHHLFTDTDKDPGSPYRFTLKQLWTYKWVVGAPRYVSPEDIKKYADFSVEPTDAASMFYKRHQFLGIWISTAIWTLLLGPVGFVLAYLSPYFNQYYGTFLGDWFWHKFGYKNPNGSSEARNFLPFTFLGGGLHANHHAYPDKPNKAYHWFEVDFFYYGCVILSWLGVLKFTKTFQSK